MSDIETDFPAFPTMMHSDMPLRDYFAAKAMLGICSSPERRHAEREAIMIYITTHQREYKPSVLAECMAIAGLMMTAWITGCFMGWLS